MKFYSPQIFLFFALMLMASCNTDTVYQEELTEIQPLRAIDFIRYDRIIADLDTSDILADYYTRTASILPFRVLHDEQLLGMKSEDALREELRSLKTDTSFLNLYQDVQSILGDLEEERRAIAQTLENRNNLLGLPPNNMSDIYGFISGFTYQTFVFDDGDKDGIGIGLEMFLGDEFPYQQYFGADPRFSSYLTRTYNKEHLVRKVAEVLSEDALGPPEGSDFLSLMIWGGKKLYLIDEMISFAPDSIVTEYTQDQLNWCRENEAQIWSHFFEEELFYETDIRKFNKLISPSPTSPGMPPESPGQTANYMGWQIVKAYMKRNPDISAKEMLRNQDAQGILDQSRYKPER